MIYKICPSCNGTGLYWNGYDIFPCKECNGDTAMKYERIKLVLLGRELGTYTGWDEIATSSLCFYDVVIEGIPKEICDMNVWFDQGLYEYLDKEGEILEVGDLVSLVNGKPLTVQLYDIVNKK